MKISASLYSRKNKSLEELVKELDALHIDAFHIDCNDDPAVFEDIRKIRSISNTPIDLHIISNAPEQYFDSILEHNVEYVQFQYETLAGKPLNVPKSDTIQYGLAIISDTPVEVFEKYKDEFSFILLMTTTPGQSGGVFRKENFNRIRRFGNLYPDKRIHVDGGVNDEVSFILRSMGVDSAVSGSFLVNHQSIGGALVSLKHRDVHSHYKVRDIIIEKENLPVLSMEDTCFREVIQAVDDYNLGFALYADDRGKFQGISSNADIRKGLIKNLGNLHEIPVRDIVNTDPVFIYQETTIADMLEMVKSKSFPVLFLPVVDDRHLLVGAVTFNNLIRGE